MLYRAEQLKVVAGQRTILDIPALSIEAGRIYGLLGANGAGKTTLLNILAFLEAPSAGSMEFAGKPVCFNRSGLQQLRQEVVMVAQHPVLFSTSVYKNIEFGLKIRRIGAAERQRIIDEALARVDLSAFKQEPVQGLSGGEIQRIALARALALSPRVLLCDEPTSSVDVENQTAIIAILQEMNIDQNISIIFTSHDRLQAAALAHHTLILEQGALVTAARENIFPCTITATSDNRVQICLANRTRFNLPARETNLKPGRMRIALDPEGIILLSRQNVRDKAEEPDILKGRIVQLMAQRDRVRMTVDTGVLLTVLPDPESYQRLAPSIGDQVYLRVPVEAIR